MDAPPPCPSIGVAFTVVPYGGGPRRLHQAQSHSLTVTVIWHHSRKGPYTVPSPPHLNSFPATQHLAQLLVSDLPPVAPASQLNIGAGASGAFSQFVLLAINSSTGPVSAFNPYSDNLHFLIGAYIIEDVVPTAWEVRSWS